MKKNGFFWLVGVCVALLGMGCAASGQKAVGCAGNKPSTHKGLAQTAPQDECPNTGEPKQVE
ncbi:hypothetical protein NHP190003_08010 [Helicobacter sp. NHP19-003]|uniref:Lipoprotein n=1 Tax=Helicobacter gastrocanis TaxID=2849641 RepID=A0ABM7SA95_9HELI|nr:hypothetical protein [Helicobacter sp. NHP19-003]BCZ17519.1 hypothetical protein NHP190003_08010 [Helicobacter sp. NHP19-003]